MYLYENQGIIEKSEIKYNGELKGYKLYNKNGSHFWGYLWLSDKTTREEHEFLNSLKEHFPVNIEDQHAENKRLIKEYKIEVGQHYKHKTTGEIIQITFIHSLYGWILDDKGNNTLKTQTATELIKEFDLIKNFDKTAFLLELRTLEQDKNDLTTSDLQGCILALAFKYFKDNPDAESIILEYLSEVITEQEMFNDLGV